MDYYYYCYFWIGD